MATGALSSRLVRLCLGPVFSRFVLSSDVVTSLKTVGSTIRQRKMLLVKLCFINVYTYPNPKPTSYSNADTLNILVKREKNGFNIDACMRSKPR